GEQAGRLAECARGCLAALRWKGDRQPGASVGADARDRPDTVSRLGLLSARRILLQQLAVVQRGSLFHPPPFGRECELWLCLDLPVLLPPASHRRAPDRRNRGREPRSSLWVSPRRPVAQPAV